MPDPFKPAPVDPSIFKLTGSSQPLTPAQQQLQVMKAAFLTLPEPEQNEIQTVLERLRFLQAKYGSSAKLAIVAVSIEIAVSEGQ